VLAYRFMHDELVRATLAAARAPGLHATAIPALQIIRADRRQPGVPALHKPSMCFLVQGAKQVSVGEAVTRYGAHQFLFTTLDLPLTGEIIEATPARPYLTLVLEVDPTLVFELASAAQGLEPRRARVSGAAMFVSKPDAAMTDACHRLVRCLGSALDVRVLAPGIIREIVYRLLRSPFGDTVRELGVADSQTRRIAAVIERLKADFAKPLRIQALARIAGMSVSSFHQHFRRVTTLSPLQYQKQLRLLEARRLLLGQPASAASVAFQVGYESPSQFSREYARCFGLPPLSDVKRIAAATR